MDIRLLMAAINGILQHGNITVVMLAGSMVLTVIGVGSLLRARFTRGAACITLAVVLLVASGILSFTPELGNVIITSG